MLFYQKQISTNLIIDKSLVKRRTSMLIEMSIQMLLEDIAEPVQYNLPELTLTDETLNMKTATSHKSFSTFTFGTKE